MNKSKKPFNSMARCIFWMAALLLIALPATAAETPGQLVEVRSKAILTELVNRREEFRDAPTKLHDFVRSQLKSLFDNDYSARLVLGRHSRTASNEQIVKFADALSENLLKRYGDALLDVDPGLDVKIKAETPLRDGKIVRVATQIVRRAGAPVPVDYMFRQAPSGWLAFDVIVEGVSYVQTYRNQFDELLRSQSLDEVTVNLASGAIRAGSE